MLVPILDALDYLHTLNPPIIHRDIKPQNVRITPRGKVCLVDFGIAKIGAPSVRTETLARAVTSGFSPFEQYSGGSTDARSDLYSLGATLYFMLSGVTPPDAQQRVRVDPLTPLHTLNDSISPTLEAVIARMMAVWPDDRFADIAAIRQALQSGLPIAPGPQPAEPPQPPILTN